MRTNKSLICAAVLCLAASCQSLMMPQPLQETRKGELSICFVESLGGPLTKAALPDTNAFHLSVQSSSGKTIYDGTFGAAPQRLVVDPGTYTVRAVSRDFSAPLFDAPQYGDTQVVVVKAAQAVDVSLACSQLNAGIRLNVDPSFLTDYPDGVLFLQSSGGKLMYSYSERRIAYFLPGSVSLSLVQGASSQTLFTRRLEEQQVLTVNLKTAGSSAGEAQSGGISVSVDTSRVWLSENFTIGGSDERGNEKEMAYSVAQARENVGASDVWVYGYIVGGDLSSSRCSFEAPFSSRTNLVIASKSSCTSKESCLSVQLAQGDIRDELNLVDNEELLGRKVYLKGDIVASYYGIPGLQCVSEYAF